MATLFLDIETTGLSRYSDEVTSIVWHYEGAWHKWVNGLDDNKKLIHHWKTSDQLCTYNGKCFDEPFVCKFFDVEKHKNHLDFRYVLAKKGLKGGLKRICDELGFHRNADIQDVDGYDAVRFWNRYKDGDTKALESLLYYNAWDVLLLKMLYSKFIGAEIKIVDPPFTHDRGWLSSFLARRVQRIPPIVDRDERTAAIVADSERTQIVNRSGEWYGSAICFTGTLETQDKKKVTRSQARNLANRVGFVWTEDVITGTTHLVMGKLLLTSRKAINARRLGVTILSQEEFFDMIESHSEPSEGTQSIFKFPTLIEVRAARPKHVYAHGRDGALATLMEVVKSNDYQEKFLYDHMKGSCVEWAFPIKAIFKPAVDIKYVQKSYTLALSEDDEKEYSWEEWQQGSNFSFAEGDIIYPREGERWEPAGALNNIQVIRAVSATASRSKWFIDPIADAKAQKPRHDAILQCVEPGIEFSRLRDLVEERTGKAVSLKTIEKMAHLKLLSLRSENTERQDGLVTFCRWHVNDTMDGLVAGDRTTVSQEAFIRFLITGSLS